MRDPLRDALYCAAIITLGGIFGETVHLGTKAGVALDAIPAIATDTRRTEIELAGLLNVTRQVAIKERQASDEQIKQIVQIGVQTQALLSQASGTLADLDEVAKQALGGAATDEQQLALLLAHATQSVTDLTKHSDEVLDNAAQTLNPAATQQTMQNVVAASANVAHATADAAASMVTVRKGIDYEVGQLMAPVKKVKAISEEAVRILGKFFGY